MLTTVVYSRVWGFSSATQSIMGGQVSRSLKNKLLALFVFALLLFQTPAFAYHQSKDQLQSLVNKTMEDSATAERFKQWTDLINSAPFLSDEEKVAEVNTFFNQMEWVEDEELWGVTDYWATPIETLLNNAGDCEDYSIAKYFTLLKMGISEEQLSISYAKLREEQRAHMVLSYYPDAKSEGEPLILDNMRSSIETSSERDDIQLVYHINSMGFWHDSNPGERLGSASDIYKWRTMMSRHRTDQVLVGSDILLAQIFRDLVGLSDLDINWPGPSFKS